MKLRNLLISFVLLLGLVHFSPQFVNAESNDAELQQQEVTDDPSQEVDEQDIEVPEEPVNGETNEQVKDESDDSVEVAPENEQQANEEPSSNESVENDDQDATEKVETQETETEELMDEEPAENPAEKTSEVQIQTFSAEQVLESGVYDDRVIELKKNLNQLGFTSFKNPNTYYASKTKQGVEEFQSYYDLPVTGVADEGTLSKITGVLDTPFQKGKRHADSVEIKEQLTILGYASFSNPTTYYGVQTEEAVKAFQRDNDLPESGIVDFKTRTLLDEQANVPLQSGMYSDDVITLKENLNQLGFTSFKNPNTYYASKTKQGVEDFQSYYGLAVTGVADQGTLAKIAEVLNTPFQKGKRHADSIEIKEQLTILGYANFSNPTTYYGVQTEKAVKAFQKDNGLPESGIVDPKTRALLEEQANVPLQSGMYRADVITLKENLNQLGFTSFKNPNTYYASKTKQGVEDFQSYYGLPVTGIADEGTLAKMSEVLKSPFQKGKRHADSIEIKEQLTLLGYVNFTNPTNYYGLQTEKAVKSFQEENGLPESGIVDYKTRELLKEQATTPLQSGMYRSDAVILKENLNKLGFTSFKNPNDYFASKTEKGVKDLQKYYGLPVTGVADQATLTKINDVLASPFQKGKRHKNTVQLKEKLVTLGYANFKNPTNYYGVQTEEAVKKFQRNFGLPISGIADENTVEKIEEALEYEMYDLTLNEALNIQMAISNPPPQTDKYRNSPAYVSSNYISAEIHSDSALNVIVRTAPKQGSSTFKYSLKPGTKVEILGTTKGDSYKGNDKWYKIRYNNEVLYVNSILAKAVVDIPKNTSGLNVRSDKNTSSHVYGILTDGAEVDISGKSGTWFEISYEPWRNATRADTKGYLDPNLNDEFQHLDLSTYVGATASELNDYLKGKGILEGRGAAFIEASRTHNINELYLVSHALLETGHGDSKLANGIEVNGKTVYNMFGIGAADSNANKLGAERAYEEGWFTPEDAIIGGAKFIGQRYIHNGQQQNTLYKMRWNPAAMEDTGRFGKQYATDIGWAVKQTETLRNMHEMIISNPVLKFNIVQYRV